MLIISKKELSCYLEILLSMFSFCLLCWQKAIFEDIFSHNSSAASNIQAALSSTIQSPIVLNGFFNKIFIYLIFVNPKWKFKGKNSYLALMLNMNHKSIYNFLLNITFKNTLSTTPSS